MKKAFINALPKSGTNLVGKCLELFGYYEVGGFSSSDVLSHTWKAKVKRILWNPLAQGYIVGVDSPVEIRKRPIENKLAKAGERMFLFGHLGYTMDLLYKISEMGFVPFVMLRDPRAVLNSFVHYVASNQRHALHSTFIKMDKNEQYMTALNGYFSGKVNLQPMKIRCKSLDPWIDAESVQLLQFEKLVGEKGGATAQDQRNTLEMLCSSLDIDRSKIDQVIDELHGPGRHTFRKGLVDSWKEETPAELIGTVNRELEDILSAWGYSSHR